MLDDSQGSSSDSYAGRLDDSQGSSSDIYTGRLDNSRGIDTGRLDDIQCSVSDICAERLENSGGSDDNRLKDSQGNVGDTYAETLDMRLGNEIGKSGRHISGTDRVVLEMSKCSRFLTILLMTVLLLVWKVKAFRVQEYALKMNAIL